MDCLGLGEECRVLHVITKQGFSLLIDLFHGFRMPLDTEDRFLRMTDRLVDTIGCFGQFHETGRYILDGLMME